MKSVLPAFAAVFVLGLVGARADEPAVGGPSNPVVSEPVMPPDTAGPAVVQPSRYSADVDKLLNSTSKTQRANAANRLGKQGDSSVIPYLRQAASSDNSTRVRREATHAINRIQKRTTGGKP